MTVQVNITQFHIRNGTPCSSGWCPLALGFKDLVKPDVYVSVEGTAVVFIMSAILKEQIGMQRVQLPQEAQDFVRRYDDPRYAALPSWSVVRPITFPLDIPDHFLKERTDVQN